MGSVGRWVGCAIAVGVVGCGADRSGEPTGSETAGLVAPTQVNTFAVLASGRATFLDRTQIINGNVGVAPGSGDSITAWYDSKIALGKSTLGQRVVLKDRAALGDLFATTVSGSLGTYTSLSPYSAPPAPPPIATFTAGSTAVTVNSPATLAAGNYGTVTVNSTLTLSGGTYQVQSVTLNNNAIVQASAASILRVAGKITGGNNVRLTTTGTQPAGNLRLIVAGATDATGGVLLGTDATLKALVVSKASFVAGARLTASGAIASKDINTGIDSKLTFATGFECNSDAGCDDGNPCTTDSCVDAKCLHPAVANGTACPDDGNACTSDACNAGVCAHPARPNGTVCPDDGNLCTSDACSAGLCAHPARPNGTACTEDGNVCTSDACMAGVCSHPPNDGVPCPDDSNECTADTCLGGSCTHPALADGTACASDGALCTADVCKVGSCSHDRDPNKCGTPDAQPAMPLQARWIYPNGKPIRSFSFQPAGSASLVPMSATLASNPKVTKAPPAPKSHVEFDQRLTGGNSTPFSRLVVDERRTQSPSGGFSTNALVPPTGDPIQQKTLQIRNATADALGKTVAYSIVVRTWGMGNFAADSVVIPASSATVLDPGISKDEPIDLMAHLLVKTPHMAAKADFAVGLHEIVGGVITPTPYAYVGVPGFYYNHTDDYSGVYTYGLERPPAGGAPDAMQEGDGLVERYRNHVLGGDMFRPDGFYGDQPAAEARAAHQTAFFDRGAAVFGVRPSTHEVDPTTGALVGVEPALPPEGIGGTTNPYDPLTGPTTLCFRWPLAFLDKGAEAYPAVIAGAEWNGLVEFVPASYGLGELFRADGTPIGGPERLDADGCLGPHELGTGDYLFRVFTADIEHNGTRFEVKAAEPVDLDGNTYKIAPERAASLTASVYIWTPGGGIAINTGYWSHTTNVAGIASHTIRRHFNGVSMGLLPQMYRATVDSVDCDMTVTGDPTTCQSATFPSVSHFDRTSKTLFIDANADVWTHDARWKFVVGHEIGHQVQLAQNASLAIAYRFQAGTDISSGGGDVDPASSLVNELTKLNCSCDVVDEENSLHCLQSIEASESAANEGFGHFFATRLWNRVQGEAGYDANVCNFTYYKQTSASDLVMDGPQVFPVYVDCSRFYAHRDMVCNDVFITDDAGARVPYASEIDWLTFYWKATSTGLLSVDDLLDAMEAAITAVDPTHSFGRAPSLSVENIIEEVGDATIHDDLDTIAHDASVHRADP
jgi:hypothetical protein